VDGDAVIINKEDLPTEGDPDEKDLEVWAVKAGHRMVVLQ
jgi:hypothetical protein